MYLPLVLSRHLPRDQVREELFAHFLVLQQALVETSHPVVVGMKLSTNTNRKALHDS